MEAPISSVEDVSRVLDGLTQKWAEMEAAEKSFRSAIDEVLTERRTDALLASVESRSTEIAASAQARAAALRAVALAEGASVAETQAAADALESWSVETKAVAESKGEMQKDLNECAKRRKKEGRNSRTLIEPAGAIPPQPLVPWLTACPIPRCEQATRLPNSAHSRRSSPLRSTSRRRRRPSYAGCSLRRLRHA